MLVYFRVFFFQKHGDVDSVTVLRERDSMKSKGFGFVKFHRAYHCALAFENCDRCKSFFLFYSMHIIIDFIS